MDKIESKGMFIPNVICNSEISNDAKYLYGWIRQTIYYMEFTKTIKEIMQFLQCSELKARKCLKELKDNCFIKMYLKGNQRHIIPTITEELIILESKTRKREREQEEKEMLYAQWWNSLTPEEQELEIKKKEMIKQFYEDIK